MSHKAAHLNQWRRSWVPDFALECHILSLVIRLAATFCALASVASAQSASDFYPNIPAAQSAYTAYADAQACDGPELAVLLEIMDVRMSFARASLVTDNMGATSDGTGVAHKTGLAYVALGDLALSKGCSGEARSLYLTVVETFTGEVFSALRQRAGIGIDDLRARS